MKDAARNCTVEGTFDLTGCGLEAFFAENDLDYAAETTLTRIITPAGKSRAFVNDVPVQLAQLRELGTHLIDIHSQHQNLILSSEEFRTSALDTVAGNGDLLTQYAAQYARMSALRRELASLREAAERGRRDEEWLRFQCDELTAAALRAGEQAELEEEPGLLENADRIGETLTGLRNALDSDETGVLTQLKNAENALGHLRGHYPTAGGVCRPAARGPGGVEGHRRLGNGRQRTGGCRSRTVGETVGAARCPDCPATEIPRSRRGGVDRPAGPEVRPSWRRSSTAARRSLRRSKPCRRRRQPPKRWPTGCTRHAKRLPETSKRRFWRRWPNWACRRPSSRLH